MSSQRRFLRLITGLLFLGAGIARAADFPPLPEFVPDPVQLGRLTRSLALLRSSTAQHRNTVRILFYGQSIAEQAWSKTVETWLRTTYPDAHLVITNRALGGHASQLLVKTAEADLYPFQPDLLVFHVYGDHNRYEDILRRVRERTVADVLLQTHHFSQDDRLDEPTDPVSLTPKVWNPWQNHVFLPAMAEKYAVCRTDIHAGWKAYLATHHLEPAALLRDSVHLNAHGEWLMARLIEPYLEPRPTPGGYHPLDDDRVKTFSVSASALKDGSLDLEFEGTRLDAVLNGRKDGSVTVLIDGKKPSEIPSLRGPNRTTAFPGSNWPMLLQVGSSTPPVAETWTAEILGDSVDATNFLFRVRGSVTGNDGEGVSTNRFVSRSGRVVIEPTDWNLAYCVKVFQRPVAPGTQVHWTVESRGVDRIDGRAATAAPGIEDVVTLAQGLAPGQHTVRLDGETRILRNLRSYRPPLLPR